MEQKQHHQRTTDKELGGVMWVQFLVAMVTYPDTEAGEASRDDAAAGEGSVRDT